MKMFTQLRKPFQKIVSDSMHMNAPAERSTNCAGGWATTVSTGDHCDQGREGAEAGDGHQCQPKVSCGNLPSPKISIFSCHKKKRTSLSIVMPGETALTFL